MWEREHPEEVKKMQMAEEQKKMAEKAKKMQEEAQALAQKSKKINESLENPKPKNETKKVVVKVDPPKEKSVDDLLAEGKSLGEIQNTL